MEPRPRILVVDDDEALRTVLVETLEAAGYEAEAVGGVELALRALQHTGFDLVLSDVNMGSRDGFELLAQVRASDPSPPVVLMSSFGAGAVAERARREGAVEFLDKPFGLDDLVSVVARTLKPS